LRASAPSPPTTASVRLRRKIDLALGAYAQACQRLVDDPRLPELWPEFLIAQHGIVRATVPLTETAAERSRSTADTDPVAPALVRYLEAHVDEELGHDDMLLDDLEVLGVDRAMVLERMPSPAVASLVGSQYYWILHHHPIAFLGFVALMDYPPAPELIETLVARTGYPRAAFRTLDEHSDLDPEHCDTLDRTLDSLPLSREHEAIMGISALHSVALLPRTIEELLEA
jgi:heme oxygenase-like protein